MLHKRDARGSEYSIDEIGLLLPRIYKKYRAPFARRIAGSDITVRGALLLRAVAGLPHATVGQLARDMAVTASTASITLSGLERKGLLRRRYWVLGRSRTALELTAAGLRTVAALRPSFDSGLLSAALRRLRPSERGMLLEGLRRLDAVERSQERRTS